jgi:ankyrin repeat protein
LILAASKYGYENDKIVKLLLAKHANVAATDDHGRTALALALKNHRTEIVPLLGKAGHAPTKIR